MSLIVTGASGQLGRAVTRLLAERVPAQEIVLVTRDPAALSAAAPVGATVRRGDFDDPAGLAAAFAGGTRLLLISTDRLGARVAQHRAAIAAATAAGVGHVIYTSVIEPGANTPLGQVAREHHESEQALQRSGLAWTFLRNSMYADYLLPAAQAALATGAHLTNAGGGTIGYVAREDCAAAAAAVLAEGGHEGRAIDITGPAALSAAQLATIFSRVGGVPVAVNNLDDAAYDAALRGAGLPEELAGVQTDFGRAIRLGQLAATTDMVEQLTGRPARTVEDLLGELLAAGR